MDRTSPTHLSTEQCGEIGQGDGVIYRYPMGNINGERRKAGWVPIRFVQGVRPVGKAWQNIADRG